MSSNDVDGILVIGAGLGKTGTNSLKLALEILYKKPCYHLKDLYSRRRQDVPKWLELERDISASPEGKLTPSICNNIFNGYIAAVDHPSCVYYKELLDVYPKAKIVLTTRNAEMWLAGCRATILPRDLFDNRPWSFYFIRSLLGLKPMHEMYLRSWRRVFGEDMDFSHDTQMLNRFVDWTNRVSESVSSDRLLIYNVSEGWKPLCQFLGFPIPDCPFPHVSEHEELCRYIRLERRSTQFLRWSLPGIVLLLLACLLYRLW